MSAKTEVAELSLTFPFSLSMSRNDMSYALRTTTCYFFLPPELRPFAPDLGYPLSQSLSLSLNGHWPMNDKMGVGGLRAFISDLIYHVRARAHVVRTRSETSPGRQAPDTADSARQMHAEYPWAMLERK